MSDKWDPYVCELDEYTQKKALDELYEDPKNRQGAIDTFREWILQQKHMKCPMDNVFLLGFLRAKHFSQLEARDALEKFMKLREKLPEWLKNIDPQEKEMAAMLKEGLFLGLPKDSEMRRVGLMRASSQAKINKKRMMVFGRVAAMMGYMAYLNDEMTQVHGTVNIQDLTGHTMAKELAVPMELKKNLTTMMAKTFPARLKAFHMYNPGAMMDFLMSLMSTLMPEKLRKRMHVHNHGLESLYKHIPMEILPEEYLPDDYTGPNSGTVQSLIDLLVEEFHKPENLARIKYLSSEEFYIKMEEKDKDVAPAASFRKLNVD